MSDIKHAAIIAKDITLNKSEAYKAKNTTINYNNDRVKI